MHIDRTPNHILDDWNIDAKVVPHPVDKDGLDVRGLKVEGLLENTDEIVARTVHIISSEVNVANTEERASRLRTLAANVLERYLSLEGELLDDVELVLAELIQNAHRYSVSGPVWVSIVQTLLPLSNNTECILDITVANDKKARSVPYQYLDDDVQSGDDLKTVDVHGRGSVIVEALSLQHGSFRSERVIGAYALMRCTAVHDMNDNYRETA
jgi:hypothetical protein